MARNLHRRISRCGAALALLAGSALLLGFAGPGLQALLVWIDFLAPIPGLSGLAILMSLPIATFAVLFALDWILSGFREDPRP
jgi:hypothetical protein